MTKDELLRNLKNIKEQYKGRKYSTFELNVYAMVSDVIDFIEEEFSNPPLKFEELKEGMWVWDDVTKRYMKVYDISYSEETFNVNGEWYLNDLYLEEFMFEQSRFYRREVRND